MTSLAHSFNYCLRFYSLWEDSVVLIVATGSTKNSSSLQQAADSRVQSSACSKQQIFTVGVDLVSWYNIYPVLTVRSYDLPSHTSLNNNPPNPKSYVRTKGGKLLFVMISPTRTNTLSVKYHVVPHFLNCNDIIFTQYLLYCTVHIG
jgi:hypothetical protein